MGCRHRRQTVVSNEWIGRFARQTDQRKRPFLRRRLIRSKHEASSQQGIRIKEQGKPLAPASTGSHPLAERHGPGGSHFCSNGCPACNASSGGHKKDLRSAISSAKGGVEARPLFDVNAFHCLIFRS